MRDKKKAPAATGTPYNNHHLNYSKILSPEQVAAAPPSERPLVRPKSGAGEGELVGNVCGEGPAPAVRAPATPNNRPHDYNMRVVNARTPAAGRSGSTTTRNNRPALGIQGSIVTPHPEIYMLKARRYELQNEAARLLPDETVAECGRWPYEANGGVDVYGGDNARFGGLATCSNLWTCPVCAARMMQERKALLEALLVTWRQRGGGAVLVSVTVRHAPGDRLEALVGDLVEAWTRTKRGAPWGRFKARHGVEHDVNALEVTWGRGGWHPHKHVLLLLDHAPDDAELATMREYLADRFHTMAAKVGRYASPSWAIDVRGGGGAGAYIAKWGLAQELTQAERKAGAGQTPWDLLARAEAGDKQAAALFREYAAAIKGRRQLTYSRSLGALREDLEARLAAEREAELERDPAPDPLVVLEPLQWAVVVKRRARGDLLRVAGLNDAELVWRYLEAIGVSRDIGGPRQRRERKAASESLRRRVLTSELYRRVDEGSVLEGMPPSATAPAPGAPGVLLWERSSALAPRESRDLGDLPPSPRTTGGGAQ